MLVHGVHGWGETDGGDGSVERLRPCLDRQGLTYLVHEHEWPRLRSWALIQQRRRTREEGDRLAQQLRHGDGIISYSNGAPVARRAIVQSGVVIRVWVIIAGAMPCDVCIPPSVKKVIVLHSHRDYVMWLAEAWTWLNPLAWVLGHDWGMLGRYGYTGDDPRVRNWAGREHAPRHLSWFDPGPLEYWGPKIAGAFRTQRVKGEA